MTESIFEKIIITTTKELERIGFKKRAGEIYTYEPAKGFIGWLGLNHAKRESAIEINPVVGIRSQELEKMIANIVSWYWLYSCKG